MANIEPTDLFFTSFEPKLANRFICYVEGIPAFMIKSLKRPQVTNSAVIINHINVKSKYKGETTWSPVSMVLYDPIAPSGAQTIMEWVKLHQESVTGRDGFADFYKKDITVHGLAPNGAVIEEFILKGAWITDCDLGEYSKDTFDDIEISLSLEYDYPIFNY